MTSQNEIHASADRLWSTLTKSERRLPLSQPIRSADLYCSVAIQLQPYCRLNITQIRDDRYGFSEIRNDLLRWTKTGGPVYRGEVKTILDDLTAEINRIVEEARS